MGRRELVPLLTNLRILRNRIRNNIQKINDRLTKLPNNNIFEKEIKQLSVLRNKLELVDILLEVIEFRLEIYIELRISLPYLYSILEATREIIKDFQIPEVILFLNELKENLPTYTINESYIRESISNLERVIKNRKEAIEI